MRHLVLLLLLPTLSYADELCITEESGIVTIESGNRAGTLKGAKCKPANKKPKAKATKQKKRAPKAKRPSPQQFRAFECEDEILISDMKARKVDPERT